MKFFDNLFNNKSEKTIQSIIDTSVLNIDMLSHFGKETESRNEGIMLVKKLIQNPKLIKDVVNYGNLGNFLVNQLEVFTNPLELQFISEISFYSLSKSMEKELNDINLYNRIYVLFSADDFLMDTIKEMENIVANPLSMTQNNSGKHKIYTVLLKMKFHDLFHENKNYRKQFTENPHHISEFEELNDLVIKGHFENKDKMEVEKEGHHLIRKMSEFIAKKYFLTF